MSAIRVAGRSAGAALLLSMISSGVGQAMDVDPGLNALGQTAEQVAAQLEVLGESLRVREALGEIGSAQRTQEMQAEVQRLRAGAGRPLDALLSEYLQAAQRLLVKAESQMASARWPTDRPAAFYQQNARFILDGAKSPVQAKQGAVPPMRQVADLIGWTQGRTGAGRVFDGLDEEVDAAVQAVFSNWPPKVAASSRTINAGKEKIVDTFGGGPSTAQPGAPATPTLPGQPAGGTCQGFAGTWKSPVTFGRVVFTQQGNQLTGTYDKNGGGTLTGTIGGSIAEGNWFHANGKQGVFRIVLVPGGGSFMGKAHMEGWEGNFDGTCEGATGLPDGMINPGAETIVDTFDDPPPTGTPSAPAYPVPAAPAYPISPAPAYPVPSMPAAAAPVYPGSIPTPPGAEPAGTRNPIFEYEVDRRGSDYRNFDLSADDPQLCADACRDDHQCRAWTYVKPGMQALVARCWLKNQVPDPKPDTCCVSGTMARIMDTVMAPGPCDGFAGTWDVREFGRMVLTQQGGQVEGTYDNKGGGTLRGTVSGNSLQGEWGNTSGTRGSFNFELAPDNRTFSGRAESTGWIGTIQATCPGAP